MFSARLRLPSSMTIEEKRKRTEFLIEMLGLKECADTYVGDEKVNTHTVLNYESQLKWPIPKKKNFQYWEAVRKFTSISTLGFISAESRSTLMNRTLAIYTRKS